MKNFKFKKNKPFLHKIAVSLVISLLLNLFVIYAGMSTVFAMEVEMSEF